MNMAPSAEARSAHSSGLKTSAVHLVRDAFKGHFDLAAVFTKDTDLVEPVGIVTKELNLPVTLLTPTARPAASLIKVATHLRHIQPYIRPCQLPDPVVVPGKRAITNGAGPA
jgi:hypothetical protein